MADLQLFTQSIPEVGISTWLAERAEAAGWDGISFTDSQNLVGDPFVAMAVAAQATSTLKFMTGVTNAATREPAALATVAATVQETSGGRMVLGIGRGDTALFHLGRKPQKLADFFPRVTALHTYLQGGNVDIDGFESRLRWLDRAQQPPVPLDIASSGPKVIAFAAGLAERVTFAIGAQPERMAWALDLARASAREADRPDAEVSFGAYINVGCHPDPAVGRELIRGSVAAFAHFSSMPGSTGAGLGDADQKTVAEVGRRYDSNVHLSNRADHSGAMDDDFLDRFAIVGPPDVCAARILELAALGLERFVITGPSIDADRDQAKIANRLMRDDLLPALRAG